MFSVEFCDLADFSGLVEGFQLRRIGCDEVTREVARSISRASLGAENECCALRHVVGVT